MLPPCSSRMVRLRCLNLKMFSNYLTSKPPGAWFQHYRSSLVLYHLGSNTYSQRYFRADRQSSHLNGGQSSQRVVDMQRRNRNILTWALAVVIGTLGLSYASVPLYRIFCQVTGFGGTVRKVSIRELHETDEGETYPEISDENRIVPDRPLKIRFNADVSARVPWRFTPLQSEIVILPGETALAFYLAENRCDEPITGIATYNIAPAKAAIYFNKVQCFCFDEQRLKPNEELDMPVFFYIDPEFADDPNMTDVSDITLSYTFFRAEDVTPEQLLQAQARAMNVSGT